MDIVDDSQRMDVGTNTEGLNDIFPLTIGRLGTELDWQKTILTCSLQAEYFKVNLRDYYSKWCQHGYKSYVKTLNKN